ncbi:MAG: alanyl-tRNA editing protein [Polyangiaceae bacterium]|nr:alanyl-tRNA editing protein [Polyangiaceae bacterium]
MTATKRLHLVEPHPLEFDAEIIAVSAHAGSPSVVLDQTSFYAEGGGQLGDRGALVVAGASLAVVDVQLDDEGRVHHVLDAALPATVVAGARARGAVERARRRDHRSQHSGQHVLSAALASECGAATVSSRLGAAESTIDLAIELSPDAVARAVALANEIVLEDREIRVLFPTSEELPVLGLRRDPKVATGVRVIDVDGFDRSPCGGTHCARTGEIGPVVVTSSARYKGGTRIVFLAGRRALDEQVATRATLSALAREFSCGLGDVPAAVAALRRERDDRAVALASTRAELGRSAARAALSALGAGRPAVAYVVLDGDDTAALRVAAAELARAPGVVGLALGRARSGELALVVERGAVTALDAGAWLRAFTSARGGRGGGRAERAEGRLGADVPPEEVADALSSRVEGAPSA